MFRCFILQPRSKRFFGLQKLENNVEACCHLFTIYVFIVRVLLYSRFWTPGGGPGRAGMPEEKQRTFVGL